MSSIQDKMKAARLANLQKARETRKQNAELKKQEKLNKKNKKEIIEQESDNEIKENPININQLFGELNNDSESENEIVYKKSKQKKIIEKSQSPKKQINKQDKLIQDLLLKGMERINNRVEKLYQMKKLKIPKEKIENKQQQPVNVYNIVPDNNKEKTSAQKIADLMATKLINN